MACLLGARCTWVWLAVVLLCEDASSGYIGRLRGGGISGRGIVVRVRTRDGMKRLSLVGDGATVTDLQRLVQRECKVPVAKQRLTRLHTREPRLDLDDADRTMASLGISHGTILQLSEVGAAHVSATTKPSRERAEARRRRRGVNLQAYNEERAKNEVVLTVCGGG